MINNREKGATSDFDDFQICYRVQHFVHFSYSHNWQSFLVFELKSPIITKKESLDNCVVVIPPPPPLGIGSPPRNMNLDDQPQSISVIRSNARYRRDKFRMYQLKNETFLFLTFFKLNFY